MCVGSLGCSVLCVWGALCGGVLCVGCSVFSVRMFCVCVGVLCGDVHCVWGVLCEGVLNVGCSVSRPVESRG